MDFRGRNPNLTAWPKKDFDRLIDIFPYRCIGPPAELLSLPALDNSTRFILHIGRLADDEASSLAHGVEAPLSSKELRDFEKGKINWTNFWSHRGWVIEFSVVLFSDEPIKTRYVPFSQLNPVFLQELKELDTLGSPYKIYHDTLVSRCEFEKKYRQGEVEDKDAYQDFILKYRGFLDETCNIKSEFLEHEAAVKKAAACG